MFGADHLGLVTYQGVISSQELLNWCTDLHLGLETMTCFPSMLACQLCSHCLGDCIVRFHGCSFRVIFRRLSSDSTNLYISSPLSLRYRGWVVDTSTGTGNPIVSFSLHFDLAFCNDLQVGSWKRNGWGIETYQAKVILELVV